MLYFWEIWNLLRGENSTLQFKYITRWWFKRMATIETSAQNICYGRITDEPRRSYGFEDQNEQNMYYPISKGKFNWNFLCILLGWYFSLSINHQVPEKAEPAFADKEIIMAALNIKSMDFNSDVLQLNGEEKAIPLTKSSPNGVTLLLDLAFSTNVRYLDDHEMYLTNIELYKTLPFASGVVMARGLLDSLMSATFFNASSLRLLRQLVTGGASFELEKSLAEGAGLRGGYQHQSHWNKGIE